jgi:hypothetical protein
MPADVSAYATLGLEPGADADAVDRAYKALIKQFHPDRAGGDAERAAEITRAYRELRELRGIKDALLFEDGPFEVRGRAWPMVALAFAAASVALVVVTGLLAPVGPPDAARLPFAELERLAPAPESGDLMDTPLFDQTVDDAVAEAIRISRSGDEIALATASRDCHQAMRRRPDLTQLDRCAAFDDTVIQLQDRDPLRDRGPFSELAVTGRLMSSATLLSNDYMAIDGRLDRIRLNVELALAAPSSTDDPES